MKKLLYPLFAFLLIACDDKNEKPNLPPSAPVLLSPANGFASDTERSPKFSWQASKDPEGKPVAYSLYLSSSSKSFPDSTLLKAGLATTEYQAAPLANNKGYFWKVVAQDPAGNKTSSPVYSFFLNRKAPVGLSLLEPENKSKDNNLGIKFQWHKAKSESSLTYALYLATDRDYARRQQRFDETHRISPADFTDTSFQYTAKPLERYFWKVVVRDGVNEIESSVFQFDTRNIPPTKPSLNSHQAQFTSTAAQLKLSWEASVDGDGHPILYTVYYSPKADFSVYLSDTTTSTSYTFKDVEYADYHTFVKASDVIRGVQFSSTHSDTLTGSMQVSLTALTSNTPNLLRSGDKLTWDDLGDKVLYSAYLREGDANFTEADRISKDQLRLWAKLPSLKRNTTYHAKLVAKGTTTKEYTTSFTADFGTMTDNRDGKSYKTVEINGKTWLAENFAYLPYFISTDNDQLKASVYGVRLTAAIGEKNFVPPTIADAKADANYAKHGVMYAAYFTDPAAGLAPQGWHVATDKEWQELELHLGMAKEDTSKTSYRGAEAHHLFAPEVTTSGEGSNSVSNKYKFGIKLGGYNKVLEDAGLDKFVYYWTSTSYTSSVGSLSYWHRALNPTKPGILRNSNRASAYRMYVRLVKD